MTFRIRESVERWLEIHISARSWNLNTAREPADKPMGIGVLGWDQEKGMILMTMSGPFPLEGNDIPLKEFDFKETTWDKWSDAHPDSKVYLRPDTQPVIAD